MAKSTITEPVKDAPSGFAVRLTATLPGSNDANGLTEHARLLVQYPKVRRYAVVELDTAKVIDDVDSGADTAVVRILRIALCVDEDDVRTVQEILLAAAGNGQQPALDDDDGAEQ